MGRPTDQDLDISIAGMLRFGVSVAAVVVLVGGILSLRHPWVATQDYSHFHPTDKELRTIAGIFRGAVHFQSKNIIQLGMLLLIATPVVRVAFCVIGFIRQRKFLYVAVSSLVLVILTYSFTRFNH